MPVCLNICIDSSIVDTSKKNALEKEFSSVCKPVLKFSYRNADFKLAFHFHGPQLEFYKKEHPEAIEIMRTLTDRKQLEILGGGYYDPLFPLLFPRDRTTQLDMLSYLVRETIGKRPRGMVLCASAWDASLVQCFSISGMEYVILDEALIPVQKHKFIPLIMSDKGKSIAILSAENSLKKNTSLPPNEFLDVILKAVEKANKTSEDYISSLDKIVTIQFSLQEFGFLFSNGWMQSLYSCVLERDDFYFGNPNNYLKSVSFKVPLYIPSGICAKIAQRAYTPYKSINEEKALSASIFDFLQVYPQANRLYSRLVYLCLLVNQKKGDKIRKKVARDKILEAQKGSAFIGFPNEAFLSFTDRQNSYKNLIEAEKIIREIEDFSEALLGFDYNGDGLNEYIFRMKGYFAVVDLKGGAIREFDVMQSGGNYADNLSRMAEFDGYDDDYERGLFIDHLFTDDEFNQYLKNKPVCSAVFSRSVYTEIKCAPQHKELEILAKSVFEQKQPVSLRKRYVATSSGMMIQYILKNESAAPLNAKFAVETSLAHIHFKTQDFEPYNLEIVVNGEKRNVVTTSSSTDLMQTGFYSNAECFLLTDSNNSISFLFEPNEPCNLSFVPIVFKRPESNEEMNPASMSFASTLFWDVKLPAGMEMEKTINFSFFSKRKKTKKHS